MRPNPAAHLGLVGSFVAHLVARGWMAGVQPHDADDLRQELTLTLLRCCDLYDPAVAGFSTYAFGSFNREAGELLASIRRRRDARRKDYGRRLWLFSEYDTGFFRGEGPAFAREDDGVRRVDDADDAPAVAAMLARLSPRYRDVLERRFGLGGRTPEMLEEVGVVYGISRERVRQIEAKAVARLRSWARAAGRAA